MEEEKLKKLLEWFEKKGDNLIGKEEFLKPDINELKKIFNITDDYDKYMLYSYPVNPEHLEKLQSYFKHKINLKKNSYFISIYSRN